MKTAFIIAAVAAAYLDRAGEPGLRAVHGAEKSAGVQIRPLPAPLRAQPPPAKLPCLVPPLHLTERSRGTFHRSTTVAPRRAVGGRRYGRDGQPPLSLTLETMPTAAFFVSLKVHTWKGATRFAPLLT